MASTAAAASTTPAREWRPHGLLVLSAMAGVSMSALPSATLGLFMEPLQQEFGWSRTEISAGLAIFAIVGLPLAPLGGAMVDRVNARLVAVPCLALSAAIFAGFGLLTGSYLQWVVAWVLYTLASIGTRGVIWNTAISAAFSASRGLAIALVLCGSALATSLGPSAARAMIDHWGWRGAYFGLGLGWGGLALLLALLFFHDRRRQSAKSATAVNAPAAMPSMGGLTVKEALRTPRLYRIAAAIFLQSAMGSAVMVHLVPLLTSTGLSRAEAAGLAAIIGVGSVFGKLASGWLIDRSPAASCRLSPTAPRRPPTC